MKKMKLHIFYRNGFIHIVEKEKEGNMIDYPDGDFQMAVQDEIARRSKQGGAYDNLDPALETDQKQILRAIGKVKANMMEQSPSSLAKDMGMPEHTIDWLDETFAYFLIEVRTDCE